MKIMNIRRIGLVVQLGTLLVSLLVFWNNWMLGLGKIYTAITITIIITIVDYHYYY
jgi:hypothetical protein